MRTLLFLALVLLALPAAADGKACEVPEDAKPQPVTAAANTYGEKLPASPALPVARVLERPDAFAGKAVVVDGKVRTVCQTAGCWMELATEGGPSCRVTMKDHAFYLPKDAAGASARVAGVISVKTIPAAQVKHMEEEGGTFASKQADGSAREVRIVATGVELARR